MPHGILKQLRLLPVCRADPEHLLLQRLRPHWLPMSFRQSRYILPYPHSIGEMSEIAKAPIPWPHKKSRKHLTNADFPLQANLMVSNLIYVDKRGFSQAALNAVKRLAAFPNPDFRLKQAMHIPVYGIPRILDCGYEDENVLGIPRGCMDSLQALLDTHEVPVSIEDQRYRGRAIDVSFSGTLRPEQDPAAKALLEEDIGVLSATTAFGKTVIGAYLIGQRKVNTLILGHSSALLE